jgi:eukaryotic-like serine/threonine-protein kinase
VPRTLHDTFGLTGTTLEGQYRADAIVGEGGFGVVYRGRHLSLDQPVAIKLLKGLDAADPRINQVVLGKFREEARLLYTLSQSSLHIVRSLDFGAVTTPTGVWAPFMVLEWLEGQSLQEELMERRQRRMPPHTLEETLAILGPVAEGLGIAHQRHVAHRDVKPANIFLLREGNPRVKVLDFGIAKIMKEGEQAGTRGTFASFTWLYAAPEQLDPRVGTTGLATDVYGFALVFTELLTGRPPVDERDVVSILKASTDPTRRPTPRTRGANIPDDVEVILRRALAVDPKARFSNVTELWSALSSARGSRPSITQTAPAPPSVVISSGGGAMQATATSMGAPTYLAPTGVAPATTTQQKPPQQQQRPHTAVPVSAPPMTSPPIGTRPPGMAMGPPMAAPVQPYNASPPMGTAPPGQTPRMNPMQQQGGSNTLIVVTVMIFVVLLLFTGMCAAVGTCAAT